MRGPLLALVVLCATAAFIGCGGDDDGGASTADLKKELPAEPLLPGYKVLRSFEWDNAVDASVQGVHLPEATAPSRAVDVYEDSGFEAGASQELAKGSPFEGPHVTVQALEFGSEEDAGDVRDFLHEQNLKQPCFGVCAVDPRELAVDGIPGAKGAQQLPLRNPPPNAPPPFESYAVQFTVGPRLFRVTLDGEPKQVEKQLVLDAARRLYARKKGES
jgi:hypothetical protein